MPKRKISLKLIGRVLKFFIGCYPVLVPIAAFCILFAAACSAIPALFTQKVIEIIQNYYVSGDWTEASKEILPKIALLITMYALSIAAITAQTQLMAYMTQGFLSKLRKKMFEGMQDLPIKYFDTHKHGDIMSYYTNDIDTLRQLVSQSLPALLQSCVIVTVVLTIMLCFSVWMTLVVLVGVVAMFFVSKVIGGGSARYFVQQQKTTGETEGFIQEMMNGQKVIKVFCH